MDLLPPAHRQLRQDGQRQDQRGEIEEDVGTCTRPAEIVDVETLGLVLAVPTPPGTIDGSALQDDGQAESHSIHGIQGNHNEHHVSKVLLWKDSQVKQKDGYLADGQSLGVEYLLPVEVLSINHVSILFHQGSHRVGILCEVELGCGLTYNTWLILSGDNVHMSRPRPWDERGNVSALMGM